jgi:type IV pilus assembly protein PilB
MYRYLFITDAAMIKLNEIDKTILAMIPVQASIRDKIIPLRLQNDILSVAVRKKDKHRLIQRYSLLTGCRLRPVEYSDEEIDELIAAVYADASVSGKDHSQFAGNGRNDVQAGSSVEFVNKIINEAIDSKASDIHFELYEKEFRVRYRIDGHLIEKIQQAGMRSQSVFSRIKIMANLDISEKRRPQDGKIRYRHRRREVDVRVSTLPTQHGEKIVLRILDTDALNLTIEDLGMDAGQTSRLRKSISLPYGMILVTGPTGSGKSTTLYAILQELNTIEKNIITVEDPIEYTIRGINQTHVKPDIGFTFAQALRAFLRQDPDVIMVGEIRDSETAEIAIRASLTGHLVLSTLHTNDSISVINRLIDMGVDSFLVASSLKLVIAQRLVRKLCTCSTTGDGMDGRQKRIRGCSECYHTGYKGRIGIFEMLYVSDDVSHLISGGRPVREIREAVMKTGFTTLHESGMEKVHSGVTTYEEINRETAI